MREILLVNPRFTEEVPIFNIPVSLFYLGSWLEWKGLKVRILDSLHYDKKEFDMVLRGYLSNASCVGFTVMSTQVPDALRLSKIVKDNSNLPVIWGGIHPTLYPEQTAENPLIDFVIVGEGEYRFQQLIASGFKDNKILRETEPLSINMLPRLRWSLLLDLEPGLTYHDLGTKTEFGASILTSKGCPHRCSFCINSILGIKYRRRSLDMVFQDLEEAVNLGIDRFVFEDEDFFADKKRVLDFLEGLISRKLNIKWSASCRTSYFSSDYLKKQEFIDLLIEAGCYFLGTGAESGSQRILDMVNKDSKVENTIDMAKTLRGTGIGSNFSFMIGLPNEKVEDMKETLNLIGRIKEENPDSYILGPQIYRPYPGSKLFGECVRKGMVEPKTLEEWSNSPYIHSEFSSKTYYNRKLYPWVEYKEDLPSLVFYATLLGLRPRNRGVSIIMTNIGKIRCKLFFFKLPIVKIVYGWVRGSKLELLLRRRNII